MNKIFQQLVEESTQELSGFTYARGNYSERLFDKEKFATLLVKDVLKFIWEQGVSPEVAVAVERRYLQTNKEEK